MIFQCDQGLCVGRSVGRSVGRLVGWLVGWLVSWSVGYIPVNPVAGLVGTSYVGSSTYKYEVGGRSVVKRGGAIDINSGSSSTNARFVEP